MMCIVTKEKSAFYAEGEGTKGEISAASPIALRFRIISQETIAFSAQVDRSREPISEASRIAFRSRCNQVPNEPDPTYGHSWAHYLSGRFKSQTNRT